LGSLKIRPVNRMDAFTLALLAEEFMSGETTVEKRVNTLIQALKNPDYQLLLAEIDGEMVGFVDQWIIHDFAHGGKLSYIQNLYVTPKHRKRGIGSQLLQEIIKKAKEKEVLEIHVVTEFENKPAINLYKKHGLIKESLQLEMECK